MTGRRRTDGAVGVGLALGAGLLTFAVVAGAGAVVLGRAPWPPWVPLSLLLVAGAMGVWVGHVVRRSGVPGWRDRDGLVSGEPGDASLADPVVADSRLGSAPLERLQVEVRGQGRVIPVAEVEWIEAARNYSRLHLDERSFLYRMALGRLVEALDPSRFVRVHKSAVVNLDAVAGIHALPTGDARLQLKSGAEVRMSRRYAGGFHERTGRA